MRSLPLRDNLKIICALDGQVIRTCFPLKHRDIEGSSICRNNQWLSSPSHSHSEVYLGIQQLGPHKMRLMYLSQLCMPLKSHNEIAMPVTTTTRH